jgi:type I restriction enzyme S subunit
VKEPQLAALPSSWVLTTLGEVTEPSRPRHSPQDYPDLPFIGMEHVESHTMRLLGTIPAASMKSGAVHFWPGDVLYGRLRPYLNKVYSPDFEGLCSAEFLVFPATKNLAPRYLQYLLNSPDFFSFASSLNEGDRPRVDFSQLAGYPFPLPPLSEQYRIVAEIDKQFTRLDTARSSLGYAKSKLRLYKIAVLRGACEGRLVPAEVESAQVEGWECRALELQSQRAANSRLPPIPESWVWKSVQDLAKEGRASIGAGPFGTIFKARDFRPEGVPVIFLRHVKPSRYLAHKPTFMDVAKWDELFRAYSVYGGELLVTKLGDPPGTAALYPRGLGAAMLTPDVMKMEVDDRLARAEFLMHYFNSPIAQKFFTGAAFGTTRSRLTLPLFRETPVPLPPLAEQDRIVEEIERRFSIVEIWNLS